jgi:hypothetical protein
MTPPNIQALIYPIFHPTVPQPLKPGLWRHSQTKLSGNHDNRVALFVRLWLNLPLSHTNRITYVGLDFNLITFWNDIGNFAKF